MGLWTVVSIDRLLIIDFTNIRFNDTIHRDQFEYDIYKTNITLESLEFLFPSDAEDGSIQRDDTVEFGVKSYSTLGSTLGSP